MNSSQARRPSFPLDQWYVAAFSWEVTDKPLARTLLGNPIVVFRVKGRTFALEDRCCHRGLPLSCGVVEDSGLRCGYHGLLYEGSGRCIEIPGQLRIPDKARVRSYVVTEVDQIVWIWFGATAECEPSCEAPRYWVHSDNGYKSGAGVFHYNAPYQLIHDNLLDLSHLGYVHTKTIGGNPSIHMNASVTVESTANTVKVVRKLPGSQAPPTYDVAWPFKGLIDRWQEVEFKVSHLLIWTGAMEAGSGLLEDATRGGFHIRSFHGITPETATTSHYFWSTATNPHPERPEGVQNIIQQTEITFNEDKEIIESQYRNSLKFEHQSTIDIHVDVAPNRARRLVENLLASGG